MSSPPVLPGNSSAHRVSRTFQPIMTCRVVITETIHEAAVDKLRQHADVTVLSRFYGAPDVSEQTIAEELRDADLTIVRAARVSDEALRSASKLRAIIVHGAGMDKIDTRAAAECGVRVITTRTANADSVAEFTLALIFCVGKSLVEADRQVRAGQFLRAKNQLGPANLELGGTTLGVIGLGQVGRRVCRIARALGFRVLAYSRHATGSDVHELGAIRMTLDGLLQASDFVSLHCALDDDTRHLIGAAELRCMKPSAILINTARGPVVDQEALIACLKEGGIAGAALDVYEREPPAVQDELLGLPNVLLTPHVAGITGASWRRLGMGCVDEAIRILSGGAPEGPTT